jgi:hypothetical protein
MRNDHVSEIITGNSYLVATCTQCETMMIFGEALSPDADKDSQRDEAFLTCPTCLQKDIYHPDDIRIARGAQKQ